MTNDKDEVPVKFYRSAKKVPIEQWPEHVRRKKEEMDAAAAASNAAKGGVFARLGGGAAAGGGATSKKGLDLSLDELAAASKKQKPSKGKGGVRVLSGAEGGVFARLGGGAAAGGGARAGAAAAAKGGVKVLSGAEGAVGSKRPIDAVASENYECRGHANFTAVSV